MDKYPLITLCGTYNLTLEWTPTCIESWKKISNVDRNNLYVISDGHLSEEGAEKFVELGFKMISPDDVKKVEDFLSNYPNLQKIRAIDLTWRKLLDAAILFTDHERIMLIDTDVYIKDRITFLTEDFDIVYMREDIPAYRAKWQIIWRHAMVPALNAGVVIFKPAIVDFEFLEAITRDYLINCKDHWWTEQSAWACIAGRCEKRLLFDGSQVRVLGGFKKRTPREVISNKYKYAGSNEIISDFEDFRPLVTGASVIHFAGLGKRFFKESVEHLNASPDRENVIIKAKKEQTLGLIDKIFISLRLFLKER